ncbi:malate dehydrogenase [Acrasis kona]|uniref:Malic enzyme n=1 Tax=Acrasis kona TaxID=1008807 RepID=A0AAW2Z4W3_9EUKA
MKSPLEQSMLSPLSPSTGGLTRSRSQVFSDPELFTPSKTNILHDSTYNKGTAFSRDERDKLGLSGLLPYKVETLEDQLRRALRQFRAFTTPIEKYIYLSSLQERNETLFYRLLVENLVETMPIVYTPTVGEACTKLHEVWRSSRGMYISLEDKGRIRRLLDNWSHVPDIIVVTDGSRILGLGDLGCGGMGIPIGKLSLYVAGAGFHPVKTLPVQLDVGTNNQKLRNDDLYLGLNRDRVRGEEFYSFADEFLMAVKDKWPKCLVQFEDFSNDVCFELLEKYRNKLLCFNDDIQGTGAVIVSGFLNAAKVTGIRPKDHKIVFFGAGSASVGVADQIAMVMKLDSDKDGKQVTVDEMRRRMYLVDSKGLVTKSRGGRLEVHKVAYARDDVEEELTSLLEVVKKYKPTALIGLSGQGQTFTEEILSLMAENNEKPIVFALSNPTNNSECSAEQAVKFTKGKCVFASGSPFPDVTYEDKVIKPGQGNNMYIFPGLGLGAVVSESKNVSDLMVLTASQVLADCVTEQDLKKGDIYPSLASIRSISVKIAAAVARQSVKEGLCRLTSIPDDWEQYVKNYVFEPAYAELGDASQLQ